MAQGQQNFVHAGQRLVVSKTKLDLAGSLLHVRLDITWQALQKTTQGL